MIVRERIKICGRRMLCDIKEYSFVGIAFLAYNLMVHIAGIAFCPMASLTGLPCAGCGLTRAFLYLAGGQLRKAADMNLMVFPVLAFMLYCGYFRYVKGTRIKGFKMLLVVLIFCMLVFYGIRMYLYFPARAPYVYTENNLLGKKVPEYRYMINQLFQMIRKHHGGTW